MSYVDIGCMPAMEDCVALHGGGAECGGDSEQLAHRPQVDFRRDLCHLCGTCLRLSSETGVMGMST